MTKHEELYAVGGRIRYLVDTPETIWGCLDSQQYLNAARRYLRAHTVGWAAQGLTLGRLRTVAVGHSLLMP